MELIRHRVNTIAELDEVPHHMGVEIDLRDHGPNVVLQHDPFRGGELFEDWLRHYRHGTLILNIKSEQIEFKVREIMAQSEAVGRYFFLDCSFPMIRRLVSIGERNIALRVSEYEPLDMAASLVGQIEWIWLDCFSKFPLDRESLRTVAGQFKVCIVSPELQGHPTSWIEEFAGRCDGVPIAAVCTKHPDRWKTATVDR